MQMYERIPGCNGCGACVLGCNRRFCIKMVRDENGRWLPRIDENSCDRCNNCYLYCPLYNPVKLPSFSQYYEYDDEYYDRDMPPIYRAVLRQSKQGQVTDFAGTLCQIAGLKSVMGDKLRPNVRIYPIHCDPDHPRRPECVACPFIER